MEAKAKDRATLRDELHELVDQLPDEELDAAHRFVEYLRHHGDPFLKKLMDAPLDDEPVTEEEEALVAEAWEDVKAGRLHSLEDVKKELGL